jgi:zinc/manganese transport system substrate-binding protein
MTRGLRLAIPLGAVALLAGCGGDGTSRAGEAGLQVVVTHPILGDIVRNVAGDAAAVEVLIPRGADPHDVQPSAQQVEALTTADLVVANGFDFEEGLLDALGAAADGGAPVFEMGAAFTAPPGSAGTEDRAQEGRDPHIWLDPVQMADAVEALGTRLATLDGAAGFEQRAADYAAEIRAVDGEIEEMLSAVPESQRTLVTNHEALGYFANRYGFEVIGAAIPSRSTSAAASAADLAALAAAIEAHGVPAVFADTSEPDDLAEALAYEADTAVEVVPLLTETLADDGEEGDDYLGLLRVDARRIAEALS